LDPEVVELVLRMARDNARWGYLSIAGECRKLGVTVSATSVRTILRRPWPRPGTTPRRSRLDPSFCAPGLPGYWRVTS